MEHSWFSAPKLVFDFSYHWVILKLPYRNPQFRSFLLLYNRKVSGTMEFIYFLSLYSFRFQIDISLKWPNFYAQMICSEASFYHCFSDSACGDSEKSISK